MASHTDPSEESPATLKAGAIGFVSSMSIGLAATSPAYSLAAIIGPVVALVGVYAPGVMLASFVPMLLIASAFYRNVKWWLQLSTPAALLLGFGTPGPCGGGC